MCETRWLLLPISHEPNQIVTSKHMTFYYSVTEMYFFYSSTVKVCGPGSSVGIAIDYGLDGPGLNPSGDKILRPSRPALVPT